MKILVLNAGSSSYKLAIYQINDSLPDKAQDPIWYGLFDWGRGTEAAFLHAHLENGVFVEKNIDASKSNEGLKLLLDTALNGTTKCINALSEINIVGHRVVHGGHDFQRPIFITPAVKKGIAKLFPLAPLHNPDNLKGIEIIEKLMPATPQVAVFDTAFYNTLSTAASTYAGPYSWGEQGIMRYGFHGISHKYCAHRCAQLLNRDLNSLKIVSCHLGNGSSLTAIDKGKGLDTTMGFTPLDGLMMGTRCGAIDPGILLFLLQERKLAVKELFHLLNYESGLKGISGLSGDMREIMRLSSQGHARSKLAYEMYVHYLKRNLGAMIAVLGGIDAIIFTAGIGENVPQIRQEACEALQQMGLILDVEKNKQTHDDGVISTKKSKVYALVIQTKEDWSIACSCWDLAKHHLASTRL